MRLFNKDGREIPFHSMERSRALILPPRYFAESDGGAEALEDVMRELHENPNTLTADLYLLRESFHIPAKFLTPELKAALVEAGAIPHPTLGGIVLMAQGVPQVIKEAEDQGWIKTHLIPRQYHVADEAFVHIPLGPRIPGRTPNSDPETARRELGCVTDREQAIVDSRPEYMKLEISITEKTKRRFEHEEFLREVNSMPKVQIETFQNYGNATFGDSSPIFVEPSALASLERLLPLERQTKASLWSEPPL